MMRKLSVLIIFLLVISLLSGCNNSESVKTPDESIMPSETAKESPSPSVTAPMEDKAIQWEVTDQLTENEDGTLLMNYTLTEIDGSESRTFTDQPSFTKDWYDMYQEAGGSMYELADYNFDGHLDVKTQMYGAYVNQYYAIRIWNKDSREFELDEDFMNISNIMVNAEKEQLFEVNYDRGLGNYRLYNVVDGKPLIVAAITVEIEDDGSITYMQVVGGNEGMTINDESEIDPIFDGYHIVIIK